MTAEFNEREGRALSRPLKTPLMLDVKRMAVYGGGCATLR